MSRKQMRLVTVAVAALSIALTMTACSASHGGQDVESAERHLRAISGVESAEVVMKKDTSGLMATNTNGALIILNLRSGTELTSRDIDYVLHTGWSLQSNRKLVNGVSIGIQGSPEFDLGEALDRDGWVEKGQPLPDKDLGHVPARLLEAKFGPWPAPVPTPPA